MDQEMPNAAAYVPSRHFGCIHQVQQFYA